MRRVLHISLAGLAVLGVATSVMATEIYQDEMLFQGAIEPGYYLEEYNCDANLDLGTCYTWISGSWQVTGCCSPETTLYLWDSAYSGMASDNCGTNGPNAPVTFTFPGDPVTAFGGYFFLTDISFNPIPGGWLEITLNDGTTITLDDPYDQAFTGFTTDVPIESVTLTPGHYTGANVYITFDNVYTGTSGGCVGDVNGDGVVDVLDLLAVIAAWGNLGGPEDVNEDGIVDVLDLLAVIGAWGPCYPLGACCLPDGTCADLTEVDCMMAQGDWYEGEECATFTCPELPMGACCIGDLCAETTLEYFCDLMAGTWWEGETCPEFDCPLIYCEAGSEYCGDEHIANVLFGTINNSSGCVTGYDDYTYLVNPMQIGVGQTITITNGEYWASDLTTVWVDWNHDGDMYDAGEEFQLGDPGGPVATGTITAPAGSYIGITTMRIRIAYGDLPDPCGLTYYGEVEDYSVDISP